MKIIYVDKPMQNEHTIEPQIIDGKVIHWVVRSECLKEGETFQEFIKRKEEELTYKKREYDGMLIYDFQPLASIDGKAGLMIRYNIFKK